MQQQHQQQQQQAMVPQQAAKTSPVGGGRGRLGAVVQQHVLHACELAELRCARAATCVVLAGRDLHCACSRPVAEGAHQQSCCCGCCCRVLGA